MTPPEPKVKLKIRIRTSSGRWIYTDPQWKETDKTRKVQEKTLKPMYAEGDDNAHPEATYYTRYGSKGKFDNVGSDPQVAVLKLNKKRRALAAQAAGVEIVEEAKRRSFPNAVAEFIAEKASLKKHRTHLVYKVAMDLFLEGCGKASLEELERKDVLNYISQLKGKDYADRTVRNRVDYLKTFFLHFDLPWPLKTHDMPSYTDKIVRAYSKAHIKALAEVATPEEYELLYFFLCSGGREKDVAFARYDNIDFVSKTFYIEENRKLGYTPKDREEARIPIPDFLLELLETRKKRHSKSQLIFPTQSGKPNGHMLRIIKRLALRAGLNCGYCTTKPRKKKDGTMSRPLTCDKHPVCEKWILHKWRKTFATYHHNNGVPARKIQAWLRHTDLETTLRYLADSDDETASTRQTVNSSFAHVCVPMIQPSAA